MVELLAAQGARLTRRTALRAFGGVAALVVGGAALSACGSGVSTAAQGGGKSTAAAGGFKVTGGTGKSFVKVAGKQVTLTMRGDDIWNSADTFTYFDTPVTNAKATWTVKVDSLDNTNAWAKAGIMARTSTDPASAHVFICVTIGNGIALQHRDQAGTSEQGNDAVSPSQTAPVWLKLTTDGKNNWVADYSTDGKSWATGGTAASTNPIDLGPKYLVGLATTAHDATQHGNAVFEAWQGPALGSADAVGTNDTAQ